MSTLSNRVKMVALAVSTACALLVGAGQAVAQGVCSSVTLTRDQSIPLGTCAVSGGTCSSDSQCNGSSTDYCMKGVCSNDGGSFCTSDSQCGGGTCTEDVTFVLDKEYTCGQFVTGDWWVQADSSDRVVVQSIVPPHTSDCERRGAGCRNGFAVDPPPAKTAYSSRIGSFYQPLTSDRDGLATPSLPLAVSAPDRFRSVVKAIDGGRTKSEGGQTQFVALLHAAVLTVVPKNVTPPADAFRPPYHGPGKQSGLYTVSGDLDVGKMPKLRRADLADDSFMPPWEEVARYFGTPMLGFAQRNSNVTGMLTAYAACRGYPRCSVDNGSSHYHAFRAGNTNRNLLRLTFEDADFVNNPLHRKALYGAIQSGIDRSWAAKEWAGSSRIKDMAVPIIFASHLLGDSMLAETGFGGFSEQDTFFDSPRYGPGHPGDYMWGYTCSESVYWSRSSSGAATDKWCGDPYGYAEGTLDDVGGTYQECCSMRPWKGGALLIHLMQMEDVMDVAGFLHVEDRYWNGWQGQSPQAPGKFAAGDACLANGGSNASANSSSCHETHSCDCKQGSPPRNSSAHQQGGGSWGEAFSEAMWSSFRSCADQQFAGTSSASYPCAGMGGGQGPPAPPVLLP